MALVPKLLKNVIKRQNDHVPHIFTNTRQLLEAKEFSPEPTRNQAKKLLVNLREPLKSQETSTLRISIRKQDAFKIIRIYF